MEINNKKYESTDYRNDWALDNNSNHIHISKAESGANGYYCLGCDKEMQACKGDKKEHYFRHHIKDIDKEKIECVVASRKYRERIAASILNELKFVKVPTLYKFPPKHIDGLPMLLEDSKIIKAAYTKSELTFYEDENGIIKHGNNPEIDDRYLWIRPDVTFFDKKDNPILFIEFVITHKLDIAKRTKLLRLGIDTIQIIIPKSPAPEIEKAIKSVTKFKWIYNELEANTQYISVPKSNSKAIQQIDEEQVKLIRESFECKSAEIKQLILSIEKCLRSESYKTTTRAFEFEISRVKENTERERAELGGLEESNREVAFERNRRKDTEEDNNYKDLETRYLDKANELKDTTQIIGREEDLIESTKDRIQYNRDQKFRIDRETKRIEVEINNLEETVNKKVSDEFGRLIKSRSNKISILEERIRNIDEEIRGTIDRECTIISRDIEELGVLYGDFERELHEEFRERLEGEKSVVERLKREKNTAKRDVFKEFESKIRFEESEITRIRTENENIEETTRARFNKEINEHSSRFTEGIKTILERERIVNDFISAKITTERYKKSREFFKKGTWKKE